MEAMRSKLVAEGYRIKVIANSVDMLEDVERTKLVEIPYHKAIFNY